MRFARPEFLWLLLLAPALAGGLAVSLARRRRALRAFAQAPFDNHLSTAAGPAVQATRFALLVGAALFLLLAVARPQWGTSLEQVTRRGVDVMLAIDISESMLAEDQTPSRLQKAREEAARLIERLEGDRVGLVAFAGSAGVLCPLTHDTNALKMFLDALSPDLISYPGSSLASALKVASSGFNDEQRQFKVIIVYSDGEDVVDREEAIEAARAAAAAGAVIHSVGLGTPGGAPIPLRDKSGAIAGYKNDAEGRVVTTRLDEGTLADLASAGSGRYFPATAGEEEIDALVGEIGGMDKKEMQTRLLTQYEERYQLPLAVGLSLLAVESFLTGRRRKAREPMTS